MPRYSNAFCIPAVFCWTAEATLLAAFSTPHKTVPAPELNLSKPEFTPPNTPFQPDLIALVVLLTKPPELLPLALELPLETTQNCFAPQLES